MLRSGRGPAPLWPQALCVWNIRRQDVLLNLFLLAKCLERQGTAESYKEAEALLTEVHELRVRTLGQDHPETRLAYKRLQAYRDKHR